MEEWSIGVLECWSAGVLVLIYTRAHYPITPLLYYSIASSLQHSIHNVQLPVAACRQTHIVGYNEQSFVAIACEI